MRLQLLRPRRGGPSIAGFAVRTQRELQSIPNTCRVRAAADNLDKKKMACNLHAFFYGKNLPILDAMAGVFFAPCISFAESLFAMANIPSGNDGGSCFFSVVGCFVDRLSAD